MHEPIKIDRKLPIHELNARRARKRITKLPVGMATPPCEPLGAPLPNPNHHPIVKKPT